jgi:hypothetical protein
MNKTLVVMAAGLGSRYGGGKQVEKVGPGGEILMEYAIYDAMQAGFDHVVVIVKPGMVDEMKALFADKIKTWRELMRLDLSQQLIQEWQTRTLSSPRLNLLEDFQDSCAIGSAVDAQGLAAALAQPNVSTEELSVLLLSVCRRLDHEFHTLLADKFGNMDSFATERISVLSTQAFLDRNPALREAFAQGPDKGRAVYGKFQKRATEINRAISRGQGDMDTLVEELGFVSKGMLILHHALGMDENA